jgi:hypothetical protein
MGASFNGLTLISLIAGRMAESRKRLRVVERQWMALTTKNGSCGMHGRSFVKYTRRLGVPQHLEHDPGVPLSAKAARHGTLKCGTDRADTGGRSCGCKSKV